MIIEELGIAELAKVSKEVIPGHKLTIGGELIDVDEEIDGLFDMADDISEHYRQRLLACLRTIIDINTYKEDTPEIDDRPIGFHGSWMDE